MSEHIASRPDWRCRACRSDWPCETARLQLRDETGGGTTLRLLGWVNFEEYAKDAGVGPFGVAYERFVGWI